MFASAEVKEYKIELDGKPYSVKGERWLGVINPDDPEKYFEGVIFTPKETGYQMDGTITKAKLEFEAETFRVCYFK